MGETKPHELVDDAIAVLLVAGGMYGWLVLDKTPPEWLVALLVAVGIWAFGRSAVSKVRGALK